MYILANWKNSLSSEGSKKLAKALHTHIIGKYFDVNIVLFPDDTSIETVSLMFDSASVVKVGAQDGPLGPNTTLTGSISLPNFGKFCDYVLLGHSERRMLLGETDEIIAQKAALAIDVGVIPVICVSKGDGTKIDPHFDLKAQLESILDHIDSKSKFVIAYEPIDAIGTGIPADPEEVKNIAGIIHETIFISRNVKGSPYIPLLYGGSVNDKNIKSFLSLEGIDGVLVGSASLTADSFLRIIKKVSDPKYLK
jgi:triosephosphate isomerase